MNPDIRELYQEVIIDHGRRPRNAGVLARPTHQKEGFNPVCGDKLTLYLDLQNKTIQDVKFDGCGCAISMASASLMTEWLKNKSLVAVNKQFEQFHKMLTDDTAVIDHDAMGKIAVLEGVKAYPMRVKCATLAWHTLMAALKHDNQTVTTE